jgi:hypothetical protein
MAVTLWQLLRRRRSLVDETYTCADEGLAWRVGFLLLAPLGFLVLAAVFLGLLFLRWDRLLPSGWIASAVRYAPTALGLAVGLASLFIALRLRAVWRDMLQAFGHIMTIWVLFYATFWLLAMGLPGSWSGGAAVPRKRCSRAPPCWQRSSCTSIWRVAWPSETRPRDGRR